MHAVPKKARPSIDQAGGTLCPQPDFLEFFSRNSLQWKYRLNYTLTKRGREARQDG
jgi:hypothetical protein